MRLWTSYQTSSWKFFLSFSNKSITSHCGVIFIWVINEMVFTQETSWEVTSQYPQNLKREEWSQTSVKMTQLLWFGSWVCPKGPSRGLGPGIGTSGMQDQAGGLETSRGELLGTLGTLLSLFTLTFQPCVSGCHLAIPLSWLTQGQRDWMCRRGATGKPRWTWLGLNLTSCIKAREDRMHW